MVLARPSRRRASTTSESRYDNWSSASASSPLLPHVTTQTTAHTSVAAAQMLPGLVSTVALLCAVVAASLAMRGRLPAKIFRQRRATSAAALVLSSLLVAATGPIGPSVVTIGLAAW